MFYEIKNIKKSYKSGENLQEVLKGISFFVNEGERIAITGPSGCGKSTLLNIMGGIDKADSGELVFEGEYIEKLSEKKLTKLRLDKFGFVFQAYHLISTLTVEENIMVPILAKDIDADEEDVLQICKEIGLEDKIKKYPHQLSGGERQRVAVARAVISKPKIIFADEATGNLDEENSIQVMDVLSELAVKHKISLIFVTHDNSLLKYADRVINLCEGEYKDK